ncbi:MAG: hypothetical protein M0C28_11750 [Candidatus Moduliflexus flocculans]|nr:hypothetical protein [Candidatus Moduliflexus flocculans]
MASGSGPARRHAARGRFDSPALALAGLLHRSLLLRSDPARPGPDSPSGTPRPAATRVARASDWRPRRAARRLDAGHSPTRTPGGQCHVGCQRICRKRCEGVHGIVERRERDGAASFGGTMRASRLLAPLGGSLRDAAELAIEMDGTPQDLAVTRMEGVVEGIQVTGKGRILDPAGAGQLDLELAVSSPLTALLKRAGVADGG